MRYKYLIVCCIVFFLFLDLLFFHNYCDANKWIHFICMLICNVFGRGTGSILFGSLASILLFENPKLLESVFMTNKHISTVVFLLAIIFRLPLFHLYIEYVSSFIFAALISCFVALNINGENIAARLLNNKTISTIGVLSYSIYIWQQLFTVKRPWAGSFEYGENLIINMIFLVIVTYFSYYYYEKNFLKMRDRFKMLK